MFFQNKIKKYLTPEIKKEISNKSFGVYNYISVRELLLTVRRDFLLILNKINIIFGIISIILGIVAFYSNNFAFFISFLLGVYAIIFLYLFFKLLKRTYYFLKISDVIYTEKQIILGDEIFEYSQEKQLEKKLICYEKEFSEYLGEASKLEDIILEKRKELVFKGTEKSGNILKNILYYAEKIFRNSDGDALARLAIPALIAFAAYVFFMYIFYYVGYFLTFIFFYLYSFILKIILYFKNSIELKIKNKTLKIYNSFEKMNELEKKLEQKINSFKDGQIENISDFVGKNFEDFYGQINKIMDNKKELFEIIKNSKYSEMIDFLKLKKYLKINFNKPLKNMILMLEKYEKLLEKSLKNKTFQEKNLKSEYDAILTNRKIVLEKSLEDIRRNIVVLKGTIL